MLGSRYSGATTSDCPYRSAFYIHFQRIAHMWQVPGLSTIGKHRRLFSIFSSTSASLFQGRVSFFSLSSLLNTRYHGYSSTRFWILDMELSYIRSCLYYYIKIKPYLKLLVRLVNTSHSNIVFNHSQSLATNGLRDEKLLTFRSYYRLIRCQLNWVLVECPRSPRVITRKNCQGNITGSMAHLVSRFFLMDKVPRVVLNPSTWKLHRTCSLLNS